MDYGIRLSSKTINDPKLFIQALFDYFKLLEMEEYETKE